MLMLAERSNIKDTYRTRERLYSASKILLYSPFLKDVGKITAQSKNFSQFIVSYAK
jgi:hypothetical protein